MTEKKPKSTEEGAPEGLPELTDVRGMAAWLGITYKQAFDIEHRLPKGSVVRIGGRIRFRVDMIREWLEQQVSA